MRSQRQLRVGEEIRHALASVLERGNIPWPETFLSDGPVPVITVTEVQISPDLKNAAVFVRPLGGTRMQETVKTMNGIGGFFRHELARAVSLRFVPQLRFREDTSFDYASHIETILHDPAVSKDLQSPKDEEDA